MALNVNNVSITDIVNTINSFNTNFRADPGVINAEVRNSTSNDATTLNWQGPGYYRCNGCSWTCSTSCSGGCRSNCSGGCKQSCTGTCMNLCGSGCSSGCSSACSSSCGGKCDGCYGHNR